MYKIGFMGLFGLKVDFIEFWIKKIYEFIFQLEEVCKKCKVEVNEDVVFVFFNERFVVVQVVQVVMVFEFNDNYVFVWECS